jgi:dihydrofolate reductase
MELIDKQIINEILKQSLVVVLLIIVARTMWSYIKEKNNIIKEKDHQILTNQKELMDLYGQAVESQNKLTNAIDELRKDLHFLKITI